MSHAAGKPGKNNTKKKNKLKNHDKIYSKDNKDLIHDLGIR